MSKLMTEAQQHRYDARLEYERAEGQAIFKILCILGVFVFVLVVLLYYV